MSGRLASSGYLTTAFSPIGDQWKKMKRIIVSEVLSPIVHQRLYKKRCEEADHLMKYVYKQSQSPVTNGLVNVRDVAQHYCGNMIRNLIFSKRFFGRGMEDGGPGIEEKEHLHGIFTILKYVYGLGIADYVPWLEVFDLDGHKGFLKDGIKRMQKYQDPEINNRVEMWKQGIKKTEEDILDVMINLKDSENNPLLSIEEIKAQIIEIMLAAVDNPSNAVEWALAEMIYQPDILYQACKELDEISLWVAIFIPKGSQVLLSRLGLGRNHRVWEDPLTYKPERHINVNEDSEVKLVDHVLRMMSFSAGRRVCPGVVLGSTMTTILLARLIQGFKWIIAPNGPGKVNLAESEDLLMAKPLIAQAVPRLEPHVYLKLM
ncbi:UNVERIFIED_CONTAM: Isoleucine N-monooxygenase 1 [Sesamum radiatum]|uniref:Isoleucine N-monooxygenase 1 n=1 Tax=Sesamum radiatum TaxID=300843 RepID=A0AAW2SLY7_SESRA